MKTLVGGADMYDRNTLPVYVLLDIDFVMSRLGDYGAFITRVERNAWGVYIPHVFIPGECAYCWIVSRANYGKGMPALYVA